MKISRKGHGLVLVYQLTGVPPDWVIMWLIIPLSGLKNAYRKLPTTTQDRKQGKNRMVW